MRQCRLSDSADKLEVVKIVYDIRLQEVINPVELKVHVH